MIKKSRALIVLFALSYSAYTYASNLQEELIVEEKFIEKYEGFSSTSYIDVNGKQVIGYGHTILTDEKYQHITRIQGRIILDKDISKIESFVLESVKVSLSQGQTEALISLIYNWGTGNFGNSQGLKYLNQGNYDAAAIEFFSKEKGVVNINGKFSEGLYKRRQAELELWNEKAK